MLETFLIISLLLLTIVSYCIFTSCIHKRYNNVVLPDNNNNNTVANIIATYNFGNSNPNNINFGNRNPNNIILENRNNSVAIAIPIQIQNIPNNEIVPVRSVIV